MRDCAARLIFYRRSLTSSKRIRDLSLRPAPTDSQGVICRCLHVQPFYSLTSVSFDREPVETPPALDVFRGIISFDAADLSDKMLVITDQRFRDCVSLVIKVILN